MHLNKKLTITAAVVMASTALLSVTGCGSNNTNNGTTGNTGNTGNTGKKVTITFQNIYPDQTTPSYQTLHSLVDQYQQDHPNVKINYDTLNTDQQKLKLKTQAAAKEIPDITIVNPAAK